MVCVRKAEVMFELCSVAGTLKLVWSCRMNERVTGLHV